MSDELDSFDLWVAGMIVDDLPVEIIETARKHDEHRETVFETVCWKLCLRQTGKVKRVFDYVIDNYSEVRKQLKVNTSS